MRHRTRTVSDNGSARPQVMFSLAQANRSLVLVRRIVTDIVTEYGRVLEAQEALELQQRYAPDYSLSELRARMMAAAERLQGCLAELNAVGVELQDFARGRVDFPAVVAGRTIAFCWEPEEDFVRYWHNTEDGWAGRRPISELIAAAQAVGAQT